MHLARGFCSSHYYRAKKRTGGWVLALEDGVGSGLEGRVLVTRRPTRFRADGPLIPAGTVGRVVRDEGPGGRVWIRFKEEER